MSRSGYIDDAEYLALYRGNVDRSLKSKRGQAFLRELAEAMDAMPEKALISGELVTADGSCCAIGAVCLKRNADVTAVDPHDPEEVGRSVGISRIMAAEIEFMNDEWCDDRTPELRWQRMRLWVAKQLGETV